MMCSLGFCQCYVACFRALWSIRRAAVNWLFTSRANRDIFSMLIATAPHWLTKYTKYYMPADPQMSFHEFLLGFGHSGITPCVGIMAVIPPNPS